MGIDSFVVLAQTEVLHNVLKDGLAGRTSPLLQLTYGLGDHLDLCGVCGRLLGLGGLLCLGDSLGGSSIITHSQVLKICSNSKRDGRKCRLLCA